MKLMISHKIMLMTAVVLCLSVAGVTLVSLYKSSASITDVAKTDLAHLTAMATQVCQLRARESAEQVRYNMALADRLFRDVSGGRVDVQNGQMLLGEGRNRQPLNGTTAFVDEVKRLTGANCTVFLKDGSTAKRIATTVQNADGTRAVGTSVSQPVYDAVIRDGKPYTGRAWVVSAWNVTAYQPIRSAAGEVVGILFVGVQERSDALRAALLSQKVGQTGYVYTMD
ncbi:MAG TPA: Cache 3/Cache 2 fusion domain-containing protein, partial [Candidatus Acidoferrum sp.]|nr:Cache 3/Cache 2 fusion domain-containing protein [Candidatus Acidoferrum sp.]